MDLHFIQKLVKPADTKIVLVVMDGIGGLPQKPGGPTELESAHTPNLDSLARQSICGLHQPVASGITPGSGPSHLALFGYDPVQYQVGRGVLAALGVNFQLSATDVAARGNFCTIDAEGQVDDRRAGRISTQKNQELCSLLRRIELPEVKFFVETVKEYRFLLVLRGEGLSDNISDTDPQSAGKKFLQPQAFSPEAEKTARFVDQFLEHARKILKDHRPANMVLLRGFSKMPAWPRMKDIFGIKAAAIAAYPMYRGLAKLIGMQVLDSGEKIDEEFSVME
jgi:2,3-bisphosphoglycerate-independent phosphoglycerate mutase